MTLVLWDSRTEAHALNIPPGSPVSLADSWDKFCNFLNTDPVAIMIHTGDALTLNGSPMVSEVGGSLAAAIAKRLSDSGILDIPVLFFSAGGPGDPNRFVAAIQNIYNGPLRGCSLYEAKQTLRAYLETRDPTELVWTDLELALRLLSALMPYGLALDSGDNIEKACEILTRSDPNPAKVLHVEIEACIRLRFADRWPSSKSWPPVPYRSLVRRLETKLQVADVDTHFPRPSMNDPGAFLSGVLVWLREPAEGWYSRMVYLRRVLLGS